MKAYFCKSIPLDIRNLTNPGDALNLSQWLDAVSRNGWDLVTMEHAAPDVTVIVFSREVGGGAASTATVPQFNSGP